MRNNSLDILVQTYLGRVVALEERSNPVDQSHFTYIARNLLQEMYAPEVSEAARASLDIYLCLLDGFPHFKEAEMMSQTGLFPDAPEDYVSYAAQHLHK